VVKQSLELGDAAARSLDAALDRIAAAAERVARFARLENDAEELTAARLAVPIIDPAIPRILDDPRIGWRSSMKSPRRGWRAGRWSTSSTRCCRRCCSLAANVAAGGDAAGAGRASRPHAERTLAASVQATLGCCKRPTRR